MTIVHLRPRFEGANIRTWVGFRHFMYLAEEAVLGWFRARGLGPSTLYHTYGLGLCVVDSSVQLPGTLDVDDEVTAEVRRTGHRQFTVRLRVDRGDTTSTILRGRSIVALVREAPSGSQQPAEINGMVLDEGTPMSGPACEEPSGDEKARITLERRIPYHACRFSGKAQHASYVRLLEDIVDRYLHSRGLAVGKLLAEPGWIPVVSRARVRILADARIDELLHASFTVTDLVAETMFDGQLDCHVERGGQLTRVATGRILHGYAVAGGPDAGRVVTLDRTTMDRLAGGGLVGC